MEYSVRSRLYFSKQNDEDADPDLRVLKLMKSNYSQAGTTVNVKWQDGIFIHQSGGSQLDRNAAMQKAKRVSMQLLDKYNSQGRNVNASGGSSYAPKLFAADNGCEGITKRMFGKAMNALFSEAQIVNENTKRATRILRK